MVGYFVPHRLYPAGHYCDPKEPLPYICLAAQKKYCSLYLSAQYTSSDENKCFQQAWKATGKKMNMGNPCVRFRNTDDLPLKIIAEAAERLSVDQYIDIYDSVIKPKPASQGKPKKKHLHRLQKGSHVNGRRRHQLGNVAKQDRPKRRSFRNEVANPTDAI